MAINIAGKDVICPSCNQKENFSIQSMDERGGQVQCGVCRTKFTFTPEDGNRTPFCVRCGGRGTVEGRPWDNPSEILLISCPDCTVFPY